MVVGKGLMMLHQGGTAEKAERKQGMRRRKRREHAHGGSFGLLMRVLYSPLVTLTRGEDQEGQTTAGTLNHRSLHNSNTTRGIRSRMILIDAHYHTIMHVQYVELHVAISLPVQSF